MANGVRENERNVTRNELMRAYEGQSLQVRVALDQSPDAHRLAAW